MIKRYLASLLAMAVLFVSVPVFATGTDVANYENSADTIISTEAGTEIDENKLEDSGIFADENDVDSVPDIKDTPYETAVNLLWSLSIVTGDEDGNFYPDRDVTRAEATATIVRLIGQGSLGNSNITEQIYSDVMSGEWYTGYINSATKLGIISGDGDGTFRPDDSVTYEEYIKMLISAIGYDEIAQYKGGFPTGYINLANELKVFKGSAFQSGQNITRGPVALYAYNILFAKEMTVVYKGDKEVSYAMNEDNATFLESWYDIQEVYGVVVANSLSSIDADGVTDEDKVNFELEDGSRVQLNVGSTNAADYLGYGSTIYVQNDSSVTNLIISISLRSNRNKITELDSFDVSEIQNKSGDISVLYNKDDSSYDKKLNVPSEAGLVYNNKSIGSVGAQLNKDYEYIFSPASGNLTFIDNNNDNKIDVVFVNAYSNYLVDKVNTNTNKITLKSVSTRTIEIDADSTSYKFRILKNGKEITILDIKEKDVITLQESLGDNDKVYILYVSSSAIEGQASVVEAEQGTTEGLDTTSAYAKYGTAIDYTPMNVKVDNDLTYDVVYDINTEIYAGDLLAFYMNSFGQIAFVEKIQSGSEQYALLTGLNNEGSVFGDKVQLRLVTERGILATYTLKNKVNWDEGGISEQKTAAEAYTKLSMLYPNLYKVIKFSVNADNEINNIIIAGSPGNGYYDENAFTLDYNSISNTNDVTTPEETVYFTKGNPSRVGSLYALKTDCKFFTVPVNSDDLSIDADKVRVVSNYDSINTSSNILCDIYDANRNMSADVCVYYYAVGGFNSEKVENSDSLFLVDNVSESVDEDGTLIYGLTGLKDGKEVDVYMEDEVELNQESGNIITQTPKQIMQAVKKGQVLQFKVNSDGKMDKYRVAYDLSSYIWPSNTNAKYTDRELELGYFTVSGIGDGVIVFNNPAKGNYRTLVFSESIPVYKYNKRQDAITLGSVEDVELEATVFVRIQKDIIKEIIIYEED